MPESATMASSKKIEQEKKVFTQEDYAVLKKKLNVLGFNQDEYPLGFESIALVGKMLLEYITLSTYFKQTQDMLAQEQSSHQQEKEQLEEKLSQTIQERDYLATTLASFEKDATNIANQVMIVTRERDELQKKLEQTPTKDFNPESNKLRKLLEENDSERDEMQHNVDSLKEQLDACRLELSEKQLVLDNTRKELQAERENRLLVTNQLWEKERELQSVRRQADKFTEGR